ncbi:hypothetical protein KUTeg_024577 [Tegillarca granosa]|uniref:guanylate cyclase n=1 Tax=Tegillarca granosa TaxID=220873 RepID=A0ABQ9E2V3_TEGGR|nr:hypothetical protein KUTeg_024577 [Tegillarca granosa]
MGLLHDMPVMCSNAIEKIGHDALFENVCPVEKQEAGLDMDGKFLVRQIYEDAISYDLVGAASKVLNIPAGDILELFGKTFFDFCQESGYDKILQVLGGNTRDFLQNLDALHDHLATIYPGMRAPSFRCSKRDDGVLILHYYSERNGLEPIVCGIVKAVASKLHNANVDVEVYRSKDKDCDHIQFAIVDKTGHKLTASSATDYEHKLSTDQKISPATFCRAFPFHIMFNRDMEIRQVGVSLMRVIPQTGKKDCRIDGVFEMVRPHMEFDFANVLSHINTVYVLRTKPGILESEGLYIDNIDTHQDQSRMRLKGQMVYVKESDCMLFLCSPSVANLDDLNKRGLYLSDIPLHDATRDLVLLSEKFEAEVQIDPET